MSRKRHSGIELLEVKIEQAEERVTKTRAAHNAAIDELKKLLDEKKALQSKELANAIGKSKRSYSEILAFIKSDPQCRDDE